MAAEKQVRTMDERGFICIPSTELEKMGVKSSELPKFEITVEPSPKKHIALYLTEDHSDNSEYINKKEGV